MRRLATRLIMIVAAIVALLFLAAGGTWLYSLTPGGQARIAALISRKLATTLPGLKLGRLGPTANGTLTASDVDLYDRDGVRAVHVDRVTLRPRWATLVLARRLAVQFVRLEGLDVDARVAADGTLNLTTLTPPSKPRAATAPPDASSTGPEWSVSHLEIARGHVAFRREGQSPIELASWSLKANASGGARGLRGAIEELRGDLRLPGQAVEPLVLDGDLRRDGDLFTLAGTLRAGTLGSLSWSGSMAITPDGKPGEYDASLRVEAIALSALAALSPGMPSGVLSARVAAHGAGIPLQPGSRSIVSASVTDSRLADIPVDEFRVDATTHDDRWSVSEWIARSGGAAAQGSASGTGTRGRARLEVSLARAEALAPALREHLPGIRGSGRVVATAEGQWPDQWRFDANGELRDLKAERLGGASRVALDVSGTARHGQTLSLVTKGRVRVSGVATPAASLAGATLAWDLRGPVVAPAGAASLRAERLWLRESNVKLATLTADLRGRADRVVATARASGAEGQGSLNLDLTRRGDQLIATLAQASVDLARPAGRQKATLLGPATIVVHQKSDEVEVSALQVRAQGPIANGDLSLDGKLGWPGRRRQLPEGHLSVGVRKAALPDVPPVDADVVVDLVPERGGQQVRARGDVNVRLTKGAARVHATVDAPLVAAASPPLKLASRGPIAATLESGDFDLASFPALRDRLSRSGLTGGTFTLRAKVAGDLADPSATVVADVRRLEYRDITGDGRDAVIHRIPGIGLALNVATQSDRIRASTQLTLYGGGFASVNADLHVGLAALLRGADPRRAPLTATFELPRFQIAALRSLSDELRDTSGWLTGRGQVSGTLEQPRGTLDLKLAEGHVDKLTLGPVTAHAESDGRTVRGAVHVETGPAGQLTAQGELALAPAHRLKATLDARGLDPAFARPFVPGLRELSGVIDAHVEAHDQGPQAGLTGQVYFYRGRVGLVGEPTFHDVGLAVALTPGRVDLKNLQVFSGGGNLTGQGHAELDGLNLAAAQLTAQARRFAVSAAGVSGGRLDGELAVTLARGDDTLTGKAKVPSATVWLPSLSVGGRHPQRIRQHDDVRFVDGASRAARERSAARQTTGGDTTKINFQAEADTVFVRSKDLDLEIESRLTLRTIPSSKGGPGLFGEVRVRRGRIGIVGQRFQLDDSRIVFDGGDNPRLDVHLQHAYPDAVVYVDVRGTPAHPEVKFRSEPGIYDQAQIVSLVLTGRPSGGGGGPSPDPTAVIATTVLAKLADKLAPQLGLDVLRVERSATTPEQAAAGLASERVEIGKYVSERLYVSYSHVFGATEAQNANEAQAEYHVSADWLAQTVFGDAGVGGFDAFWTRRY